MDRAAHFSRTGVLLVQLGTPSAPTTRAVRRYLAEFLNDPKVIDIPAPLRALLLHAVILPFRSPRSAAAYRKIWTPDGSPLMKYTRQLAAALRETLGAGYHVEYAMRYGMPDIFSGLQALSRSHINRLLVLPLFPQFADATVGSVEACVRKHARTISSLPPTEFIAPFFGDRGFIRAFAARGKPYLENDAPDHVLFSFHGLPERHIRKAQTSPSACLTSNDDCCKILSGENRNCYRAQCFETARLIVRELNIPPESYTVCFQSRLGRTPWIRPYTDETIRGCALRGQKRIAVFSPAFICDGLETLEEIGIRGTELFRSAGGETLRLIPSLNDGSDWIDAVRNLIVRQEDKRRTDSAPVN